MLLFLGYNMDAYDYFYITVWTCMSIPVFFLSLKGEDREKTDSSHCFCKIIPKLSGAEGKGSHWLQGTHNVHMGVC